jgi:hypothetical protein
VSIAATVDNVIAQARREIGKPYVYGAESPSAGFDCSGLMQYIFGQVGISLPRTAAAQQDATVKTGNPQPGDLVFYGDPAHHVGLYIGSGQMLVAPHTGALVQQQKVYGTPTYGTVRGLTGKLTGGATAENALSLPDLNPLDAVNGAIQAAEQRAVDAARPLFFELAGVGLGLMLIGAGLLRTFHRQTRDGES